MANVNIIMAIILNVIVYHIIYNYIIAQACFCRMVFGDFWHYNIFEEGHTTPHDEVAYRKMPESSSAIKYTPSGEIYYNTVYSPRLPHTMVRTYDDYVAYNNVIEQHNTLNDKKEIGENRILFFLKEMFCCR